jgi:hypothetical protein
VCATAWATEELADLVGVAPRNRKPNEFVVVILDPGALFVRMSLEYGTSITDEKRGELHDEIDDHVMHDERLGVVGDVEAPRLTIPNHAPQPHVLRTVGISPNAIRTVVQERQLLEVGEVVDVVVDTHHVI